MKKVIFTAVVLSIVFSVVFTACKKKAPEVPSENTFALPKLEKQGQKESTVIADNFLTAATVVGVWTLITEVGLALPKAAFVAALNQKPEYLGDGKWVWEYKVNVLLKDYTIRLYATTEKEKKIRWDMYVSSSTFSDFLWFYGIQNEDGKEGYWILYKSPEENHELLRIEWTYDKNTQKGSRKFINIEPESDENGGYIQYGNNLDGLYNCFYDVYNKGQNKLTNINYNSTTHIGRIKAPHLFYDDNWHCWNENFLNDYCPSSAK